MKFQTYHVVLTSIDKQLLSKSYYNSVALKSVMEKLVNKEYNLSLKADKKGHKIYSDKSNRLVK